MNHFHVRKISQFPTIAFTTKQLDESDEAFLAEHNIISVVGKPIEEEKLVPVLEAAALNRV